MAGHVCLSIPVPSFAWAGIVLVAVGTGFIKPNLSTIVGGLYDDDDIRRNAGFQLFYMSINVGSVASPLVTGWLREHYGYHAGFFSAAVGMAIALVAFVYGRNKLSAFAFTIPNPLGEDERRRLLLVSTGVVAGAAALVPVLRVLSGNLLDAISTNLPLLPVGAAAPGGRAVPAAGGRRPLAGQPLSQAPGHRSCTVATWSTRRPRPRCAAVR